jgi:hypothetical protein
VCLPQQVGVDEHQRDWTFSTASKLLKWDRFRRLELVGHCVLQRQNMSGTWRSVCADLLSHLPEDQSLSTLLSVMQVDQSSLKETLQDYGIEYLSLTQGQ